MAEVSFQNVIIICNVSPLKKTEGYPVWFYNCQKTPYILLLNIFRNALHINCKTECLLYPCQILNYRCYWPMDIGTSKKESQTIVIILKQRKLEKKVLSQIRPNGLRIYYIVKKFYCCRLAWISQIHTLDEHLRADGWFLSAKVKHRSWLIRVFWKMHQSGEGLCAFWR